MEFTFINGDDVLVITLSENDLQSVGLKRSDLFFYPNVRGQLLQNILDTYDVGTYKDTTDFNGYFDATDNGSFTFVLSKRKGTEFNYSGPEIIEMLEDQYDNSQKDQTPTLREELLQNHGMQETTLKFTSFENLVQASRLVVDELPHQKLELTSDLFNYQDNYYLVMDYFVRLLSADYLNHAVVDLNDQLASLNEFGSFSPASHRELVKDGDFLIGNNAVFQLAKYFS